MGTYNQVEAGQVEAGQVEAANALTARWAARAGAGSQVLSGAGVWPLLALLSAAADGPARAELAGAAGVDASTGSAQARSLLDLLAGLPAVRVALGTWLRADIATTPWWEHNTPAGTRGKLTGVEADDRRALDSWVREQTGGLLGAMPVRLGPDVLCVLASALTVRTRWHEPFDERRLPVEAGPWQGKVLAGLRRTGYIADDVRLLSADAGQVSTVRVGGDNDIDVTAGLGGADMPAAQVLSTMLGVAEVTPGSALGAGDTGPGLSVGYADTYGSAPFTTLTLPAFDISCSHNLMKLADLFGLVAACDGGRGHFPLLSTSELAFDEARQDARATFSATGFEASAVTAFSMRAGSRRTHTRQLAIHVRIDRPFAFTATHRASGLVLFSGWVADPNTCT